MCTNSVFDFTFAAQTSVKHFNALILEFSWPAKYNRMFLCPLGKRNVCYLYGITKLLQKCLVFENL